MKNLLPQCSLTANITPSKGEQGRGFKIKCYGRTELAQLYCPDVQPRSAYRRLKAWMALNPRLRPLLRQKGRSFTPAQVQRIISVLGEP